MSSVHIFTRTDFEVKSKLNHFSVILCWSRILILKFNLIWRMWRPSKADSCAGFEERRWCEGRVFFLFIVNSRWFHVQLEFWFSSWISFGRLRRPSLVQMLLHLGWGQRLDLYFISIVTSRWFQVQMKFSFSSVISFWRLWRSSQVALR